MESFMYAPVGMFAGGDNGDADSLSASHCMQSIATRALPGNRVRDSPGALTSGRVDMALLALLLCNDAMGVSETAAGLRRLRPALQAMRDIRVGPAGAAYSGSPGHAYPPPPPKGIHAASIPAQLFVPTQMKT